MGSANGRLMSLDALRGFDMMFIMGFRSFVLAVLAALGLSNGFVAQQFHHVPWAGLAFEDTIFPLFLFIAGASFPFSMAKRLLNGASRGTISFHVLRRGLTLILFGLAVNGLLKFDFANLRIYGVLQLIGFAWMVAALLSVWLGLRTRIAVAIALLVVPPLLFRLVVAPDFPTAAPFTPEGNLGCWFDRTVVGTGHLFKGLFDPEGAASLLSSVVVAMGGMFAGDLLRSPFSGGRKTLALLVAAVLLILSGVGCSHVVPMVKSLWSSSFVLVVVGYSAALLAIFYWVIDVRGWNRWISFLTVIGMNSITIYMAQRVLGFQQATKFLFGGCAELVAPAWRETVLAGGYFIVSWVFLYILYRRKMFLKV